MSREESFRAAMSAHGIGQRRTLLRRSFHRFKLMAITREILSSCFNGTIAAGAFSLEARHKTWVRAHGAFARGLATCARWQEAEAKLKPKPGPCKEGTKVATWILNHHDLPELCTLT